MEEPKTRPVTARRPRRRTLALAASCLLCGVATGCASSRRSAADKPSPTSPPIPFELEEISGLRPVVDIALNGHAHRAMIHANAGFYLQMDHAQADAVGVAGRTHVDSYGIEVAGQVSALGRDRGVVERLEVGPIVDRDAPVTVFETPQDGGDAVCMLGLGWISAHGLVLDFARREATTGGPHAAKALRARLLGEGYSALPMTREEEQQGGRYLVTVTMGDASAPMVVSSVSTLTLDTEFARRAGVALGKTVGEYGGPSGATGAEYESAEPVELRIGEWSSRPVMASVHDVYAYSGEPRPADAEGGMIGADFLLAHGAVVDFGSRTLYLR